MFKYRNKALRRKFTVHLIEVLSNIIGVINEDKLDGNAINNFKEIFSKALDDDIDIKVYTLGSAKQFLSNILNEGNL